MNDSVTSPTSPTPGCQIEDLIVDVFYTRGAALLLQINTYLKISGVPVALEQLPNLLRSITVMGWDISGHGGTKNHRQTVCLSGQMMTHTARRSCLAALRNCQKMKEHPDGTSKQPTSPEDIGGVGSLV